jgi:transposase-like protein
MEGASSPVLWRKRHKGLASEFYIVCKREMAQHFLLSPRTKTLSLASIFQLSDAEAEATFKEVRWASTQGRPICPSCESPDPYDCRQPNGAARYRCRGCMRHFSITSGTLFASRKRPLKVYFAAIATRPARQRRSAAPCACLGAAGRCSWRLGAGHQQRTADRTGSTKAALSRGRYRSRAQPAGLPRCAGSTETTHTSSRPA